jgi:hypothetical protein
MHSRRGGLRRPSVQRQSNRRARTGSCHDAISSERARGVPTRTVLRADKAGGTSLRQRVRESARLFRIGPSVSSPSSPVVDYSFLPSFLPEQHPSGRGKTTPPRRRRRPVRAGRRQHTGLRPVVLRHRSTVSFLSFLLSLSLSLAVAAAILSTGADGLSTGADGHVCER